MRIVWLAAAAVVVVLAQSQPVTAGEKKASALVSPPVSLNPNEGQPLCLVSNLSSAPVVATVEIVDGTGAIPVTTTLEIPPGGIDGATDVLTNFYSYCRITPQDASQLPLLRGSHCAASGNTARTCVEAR
jgi:hypothetical protein